jgi:hypothetical protein
MSTAKIKGWVVLSPPLLGKKWDVVGVGQDRPAAWGDAHEQLRATCAVRDMAKCYPHLERVECDISISFIPPTKKEGK